MKVGITMPVVLQQPDLYEMTLNCLRHLRVSASWRTRLRPEFFITLVCNRLAWPADRLERDVRDNNSLAPDAVNVVNEGDLGVAGGWNRGIRDANAWGADYHVVLANDTEAGERAIETLIDFGRSAEYGNELARGVDLWSATATNDGLARDPAGVGEGADFSFFCLRRATVERHGWFDEMFRPAYFEDNDYAARIVLGGGHHRYVYGAPFYHHGSQTLKRDAEMAHHIRYWFDKNRDRFVRKWGRLPSGSEREILASYNRTPFNSGNPLSWWGPA